MRVITPILLLSILASGCSNTEKPTAPKATTSPKAVTPAAKATAAEKTPAKTPDAKTLLSMASPDAQAIFGLADPSAFYQVLGWLEGTLKTLPAGAALVKQAKIASKQGALPAPLQLKDLAAFGLDPKGAAQIQVSRDDQTLMLLPVTDSAALRTKLAKLGSWSDETRESVKLWVFTSTRTKKPIYCHFNGKLALISDKISLVINALSKPPKPSLWDKLSVDQRKSIEGSAGYAWVTGQPVAVWAVARVAADGLAVDATIKSPALIQTQRLYGPLLEMPASASKLIGLAKGAPSYIYARLPLHHTLQMLGPDAKELSNVFGDPQNLSGEVLAVEHKPGKLVVVVGAKDVAQTQKMVSSIGKLLKKELARKKNKGNQPKVSISRKKLNGREAFRIAVKGSPSMPLTLEFGVAAGPLGVIAGHWDSVKELSKLDSTDANAFLASLPADQRQRFDRGALAALKLGVGDPFAALGPKIQQQIGMMAPPKARAMVDLARLMLDQLDSISIAQIYRAPDGLHVSANIRTLHRDGQATDDAARALWHQALAAKFSGDSATFKKALDELTQKYAQTRYGKLKQRSEGALFSAIIGAAAAIAAPAFMQYMQAAKAAKRRF
ncbi:MAG: hypothetical protein JRH20_00280 [Deltaproteobacteria bacterium]|nr:hypothetical protein [Deltaproteobacteria bacterium]